MNPERPTAKLRPIAGKESAFRTIGECLERMQLVLSRERGLRLEKEAIALMCQDGIAEVAK